VTRALKLNFLEVATVFGDVSCICFSYSSSLVGDFFLKNNLNVVVDIIECCEHGFCLFQLQKLYKFKDMSMLQEVN